MDTGTLTQLRDLLAFSSAKLKTCAAAYKGLRTFKNNKPGLAFCSNQLHEAAAALLKHAQRLATLAKDLHDSNDGVVILIEETPPNMHTDGLR